MIKFEHMIIDLIDQWFKNYWNAVEDFLDRFDEWIDLD